MSFQEIATSVLSWPAAAIVALIVLRKPITLLVGRLIASESGKAKIGPVEIELGKLAEQGKKALTDLERLNVVLAESRLLELEITSGMFGAVLGGDQSQRMQNHIERLKEMTQQLRKEP